jgi:hypothetical protein
MAQALPSIFDAANPSSVGCFVKDSAFHAAALTVSDARIANATEPGPTA